MGFEPTRAEHIGLAVHRLNRSAKDRAKGTASRGKEKEKGGRRGGKKEKEKKIIISITFHEHSEGFKQRFCLMFVLKKCIINN